MKLHDACFKIIWGGDRVEVSTYRSREWVMGGSIVFGLYFGVYLEIQLYKTKQVRHIHPIEYCSH
jgi:hypothetical protein